MRDSAAAGVDSSGGHPSGGDKSAAAPWAAGGDEWRPHARKLWPLPAGTRRVGSLDGAHSHLSRRNILEVPALLERELEERLTSLVMQMVLQQ